VATKKKSGAISKKEHDFLKNIKAAWRLQKTRGAVAKQE